MDQTAITAAIRRNIKEPRPRRVSDDEIEAVTLRAVKMLGLKIKERDPSYFNARVSIASYTNIFSLPSGCKQVANVWDYAGTAVAISGAADNGSGAIRITATAHGLADENIVTIHDVGGCTEANDTWQIDYIDADTFDLVGSTFANAYTSGGKVFLEKQDLEEIKKINMAEQTGDDDSVWYPRGKNIVVDDTGFTDDIIIDYEGAASAITDIPDEYHEYLVAWPSVNLMALGNPNEDPDYADKQAKLQLCQTIIQMVLDDIRRSFKISSGPTIIRNVWED